MSKLTIMKGLPASGKSTKAKELIAECGRTIRINKDLLRTMLHFDVFNGRNEGITHETSTALALGFLKKKINVIIDDTNLNEKTVQSWKDVAKQANAKIEYIDLTDVDINDCIARDATREKKVGKDVIINMALRTGLYEFDKKVIICDLDGTLCNIDHRLHHLKGEKKNWKAFYEGISDDTVREDVLFPIQVMKRMGMVDVVLVSGRPENYKKETLAWLKKNGINWFTTLIMRKAGDSRPDDVVKREILHTYFKDKSKILLVVDDRPRVIRMWKEEGLVVDDVGNGIEF